MTRASVLDVVDRSLGQHRPLMQHRHPRPEAAGKRHIVLDDNDRAVPGEVEIFEDSQVFEHSWPLELAADAKIGDFGLVEAAQIGGAAEEHLARLGTARWPASLEEQDRGQWRSAANPSLNRSCAQIMGKFADWLATCAAPS
jgi:hypothetical protein